MVHRVVLLRRNDLSAIGGTADSRKPPARPHLRVHARTDQALVPLRVIRLARPTP